MDKLIYVAMTGAKHLMLRQENVANNLANANTPGYRAEMTVFRSAPARGDGLPTRVFSVDSTPRADFSPGPIQQTGRALDVALSGAGWIAVADADGNEAYTRNGSLELSPDGVLQTTGGKLVLSDGGPLTVPANSAVSIAADGTVSALPGGAPAIPTVIGIIKLVNPPEEDLQRGDDGLFRPSDGAPAAADANVKLASGSLEGSNVNPVDALVSMISLARQFDVEMKLLQNAEANARSSGQLLSVSG